MTTKITRPLIEDSVFNSTVFTGAPTTPTPPDAPSTIVANMQAVNNVMAVLSGLISTALAGKQPLDSDLTAIAALTTTAIGRSLLAGVDAAALRTITGAQIAGSYQPLDSDLTAIAALTTTAFGRSQLTPADEEAARVLLNIKAMPDWIPTVTLGGNAVGLTIDAASRVGKHWKAGQFNWIMGDVTLTAKGSSVGQLGIGGLPIAGSFISGIEIILATAFTGLTGMLAGNVNAGTSVSFRQSAATGLSNVTDAFVTNTTRIAFSATYLSAT